jgi:hypothetical protein
MARKRTLIGAAIVISAAIAAPATAALAAQGGFLTPPAPPEPSVIVQSPSSDWPTIGPGTDQPDPDPSASPVDPGVPPTSPSATGGPGDPGSPIPTLLPDEPDPLPSNTFNPPPIDPSNFPSVDVTPPAPPIIITDPSDAPDFPIPTPS